MPKVQLSEQTLRFLDVLAKLVLELSERLGQGFDFVLVRDIPIELLREFEENIVKPLYPGGISHAFMELMRKAIQEQKQEKAKFN